MGARVRIRSFPQVVDLGVDTISYVIGDCSVLLYDTKVGERWGHNYEQVSHGVWYRAAQNCEALIADGQEPLGEKRHSDAV